MRTRFLLTLAMTLALGACAHPVVDQTPDTLKNPAFNRRQIEYLFLPMLTQSQRARWRDAYHDDIFPPTEGGIAVEGRDSQPHAAPGPQFVTGGGRGTTTVNGGIAAASIAGALVNILTRPTPGWISSEFQVSSDEVEAHHIATPADATAFARQRFAAAMTRFAGETGRRVSCSHNCDGIFPTYRLERIGGPTAPAGQFSPDRFYVTFGFIAAGKYDWDDPVQERILGYRRVFGVAVMPCVSEREVAFDDGDLDKFRDANPSQAKRQFVDAACRDGIQSPLEMQLLRTLTAEAKMLRASARDGVVAVGGRLYHLNGLHADRFIDYEILPTEGDRPSRP